MTRAVEGLGFTLNHWENTFVKDEKDRSLAWKQVLSQAHYAESLVVDIFTKGANIVLDKLTRLPVATGKELERGRLRPLV